MSLSNFYIIYENVRTRRANVSHARIFHDASACVVRLSSPRDLSGEEENWRGETARRGEAKRANERKKERKNGLYNRELDSMTQVRAILVPFTSMVLYFFFLFVLPFCFLLLFFFHFLKILLNAKLRECLLFRVFTRRPKCFRFFLLYPCQKCLKVFSACDSRILKNSSYKYCYI